MSMSDARFIYGQEEFYVPSMAEELISTIILVLWFLFEIFVIDSLEKMYREQPSSMTQPNVMYQAYPQQHPGQVYLTQPYYALPSQVFNHSTATNPNNPPPYIQNPSFYPANPCSDTTINNYKEKL